MTIRATTFLALMRFDLLTLTLLTAGHSSSGLPLHRQLYDHVLKFVRRLEHRHFAIRNRDDFTGTWIAGLARLPELDLKRPESSNLNIVSGLDRLLHRFEERVNNDGNVGPSQPRSFCYFFDQIGLRHTNLPRLAVVGLVC